MKKINILIVEDHALTRFALITSLKGEEFAGEIYEAENANQAFEIMDKQKIDLILMDLGLPVINGANASLSIKKKYPEVKIIVVSSHSEESEIEKCLNAGINAYCSKDINPKKLMELIADVMNGAIWFDAAVSGTVLRKASAQSHIKVSNNKYNLTQKELGVLSLLADGNSNLEIAKKMDISINTIKVHMCAILQKLSVDDRTQAAVKAIRENLI